MSTINKNVNNDEIEMLYGLFKRCQAGDKSVLNCLFKTQNRQISRVDELTEEYRVKRLEDSALNPEMEKLNLEYDNEDRKTGFKNENVIFAFDILNKMLFNMKKAYYKGSLETGYENGVEKEHRTYKKYHSGECDISELSEIMYEVIISIFLSEPDGNGCVTLNGKKNEVPIIDGVSLLKNISYFCCIQINEGQSKRCYDVPGEEREGDSQSEDINRIDEYSFGKWQHEETERWNNHGEILRLLVYADVLEWLRRNRESIKILFKSDSYEVQAIIDTILSNKNVFIDGENGYLQLVKQKDLQQLIYEQTGKMLILTNISNDFKLIEKRLIDHLLYSLNYEIVDTKRNQRSSEIKNGDLQALDPKRYFKLFDRERMFIYKICSTCHEGTNKDRFLDYIMEHADIVIPVLSLEKGRKKYDMVNMINGDLDVIDNNVAYDQIVNDIVHTLISNFHDAEATKITELRKQYKVADRFVSGKSQMWEADIQDDYLKIRFWADENTKHPVRNKIEWNDLLIYEGYENYYICDKSKMLCYIMPKIKRVISKSDSKHNVFFEKIA